MPEYITANKKRYDDIDYFQFLSLDACAKLDILIIQFEEKDLNPIHTAIVKARDGHYVHTFELSTQYSFECVMEQIAQDYPTATSAELIEFFTTAELYHLEDDDLSVLDNELNEIQLYNIDISDFINELTEGDFMRTGLTS